MKINYKVLKIIDAPMSANIESADFITVEHRENGITMWTAFIGNGENNNQKKSIKLSLSGGVFEIKRMAGNALLNAEILLKKDSFNKVISNASFKNLYKKRKRTLRYRVVAFTTTVADMPSLGLNSKNLK